MKIIAYTGNYGAEGNTAPAYYLMADSSLLKDGKPFYVPDFAADFRAFPSLVIRTSRLGKTIAPRFASRYYDAVTAGVAIRAVDEQAALCAAGLPDARAVDFDGSAIIGSFLPLDCSRSVDSCRFDLCVDGRPALSWDAAQMHLSADRVVAEISRRFTIKMGDIIYLALTPEGIPLHPGHSLSASLGADTVLQFNIK